MKASETGRSLAPEEGRCNCSSGREADSLRRRPGRQPWHVRDVLRVLEGVGRKPVSSPRAGGL